MNDFLDSIKEDLLDRSRLPYLIALCVAFVGVLAFALIAGAGSSSTSTASSGHSTPTETSPGGIPVSKAQSTSDLSAEVSTGNPTTHPNVIRDYFAPLPSSEKATTPATPAASTASSASTSSPSTSSGSSSSSSPPAKETGGSEPAKPTTPPKPKEPQKTYNVALLFGVSSPAPQQSQLTPYENAKHGLQLPSSQVALVTFTGTSAGGKGATFKLNGEAILHGDGTCLPSPTQCETLELAPGKAEQLEYLPTGGTAVTYELQVVSIQASGSNASSASSARVARAHTARRRR